MLFNTPISLLGPWRRPAQLLGDQSYDGHVSVHNDAAAAALGLSGAPIEGPTHFFQFDPFVPLLWGHSAGSKPDASASISKIWWSRAKKCKQPFM